MYKSIMINKTKQRLWNIISCGLPVDYELEALRKICLLNLIIILGGFFLILLGILAFVQQNYKLGIIDFTMLIVLAGLFSFLRKSKNHNLVGLIGTVILGAFYFFLIAYGGVSKSAYVWLFTYPLISLFLLGIRLGTTLSFVLLGSVTVIFVFGTKIPYFTSYNTDLILRIVPAYIIIILFAFVMEKVRKITQNRLTFTNIELEAANEDKGKLIHELQHRISELKVLQGIVPMCANCKKIRNDSGFWEQVEKYFQERSDTKFSHSICPECRKELYGDLSNEGDYNSK